MIATENNPDPVPFYIKIEALSDNDDDLIKNCEINSISHYVPEILTKCCEHEKKLEEFKIESNRVLKLALKAKTDEIRSLHWENKRLLEIEKRLLNEVYILKRKIRMQFRTDENSQSDDDNYNNLKKFKQPEDHLNYRKKKVKLMCLFFCFLCSKKF